jgi:hypothetical protein
LATTTAREIPDRVNFGRKITQHETS